MDEEKALVKALKHSFQDAVVTYCTLHVKKNVMNHVKEKKANRRIQGKIYGRLFSKSGLTAKSNSISDFKIKSHAFKQKYGSYFNPIYLKDLMNKLHDNVFHPAQVVEEVTFSWTNNSCESMNSRLKDKVPIPISVPELINILSDMYVGQRLLIEGAFEGIGKYYLAPWMRNGFTYSTEAWYNKTPEERKKVREKFMQGPQQKPKFVTSRNGMLTIPNKPKIARKPGARERNPKTRPQPKSKGPPKARQAKKPSKPSKNKSKMVTSSNEDLTGESNPSDNNDAMIDPLDVFKNLTKGKKETEEKSLTKDPQKQKYKKKNPKQRSRKRSTSSSSSIPSSTGSPKARQAKKPSKTSKKKSKKVTSSNENLADESNPSDNDNAMNDWEKKKLKKKENLRSRKRSTSSSSAISLNEKKGETCDPEIDSDFDAADFIKNIMDDKNKTNTKTSDEKPNDVGEQNTKKRKRHLSPYKGGHEFEVFMKETEEKYLTKDPEKQKLKKNDKQNENKGEPESNSNFDAANFINNIMDEKNSKTSDEKPNDVGEQKTKKRQRQLSPDKGGHEFEICSEDSMDELFQKKTNCPSPPSVDSMDDVSHTVERTKKIMPDITPNNTDDYDTDMEQEVQKAVDLDKVNKKLKKDKWLEKLRKNKLNKKPVPTANLTPKQNEIETASPQKTKSDVNHQCWPSWPEAGQKNDELQGTEANAGQC
jgi:hypothetical protein